MIRKVTTLASGLLAALMVCSSPMTVMAAPAKKSTSSQSSKKKSSTAKKRSTAKKKSSRRSSATANSAPKPIIPTAFAHGPQTTAAAALVFDLSSGRILFEKNADARRVPASTQKLLTALVIAEEGNLDKKVVIQHSDTLAEPVKLYLKKGDVYTRRDLLNILMVRSFNDVARALARDNAGSVEAFAAKMNQRAARLGMRNSHFTNPHGLTEPDQFSTARDMARVARAAYANPIIREAIGRKEISFRYSDGRIRTFTNTNRVLRGWQYCTGMKTGYTNAAGHCLISSAEHQGRKVIVVMLGSDKSHVWQESCSLLAWGLSRASNTAGVDSDNDTGRSAYRQ